MFHLSSYSRANRKRFIEKIKTIDISTATEKLADMIGDTDQFEFFVNI